MKQIVINCSHRETRIAIMESGQLSECYFERPLDRSIVGNIYRGRVTNVLPGMQAAFVDIGIAKNGFLYVEDCQMPSDEEEHVSKPNIRELVREGQEILVQVSKDSFGNKGPRLTTHVSLPGRYLVYMPGANHIGISRRIDDEAEKRRLRQIAESLRQNDEGIVVRTVAAGVSERELLEDYHALRNLWQHALAESKDVSPPALIYRDLGLIPRLLRDYLNDEVKEIIVDRSAEYRNILQLVKTIDPKYLDCVKLYQGNANVFSHYHIEEELRKALRKHVWLKSGGYLVIDQTEALTVIDVNTGKFVGKSDLEQTVLKTNLEAAKEAARQLRLRDIGGIILIDFIDMHHSHHQEQVLEVLEQEMKKDRTKSHILGITRLGLVEMTRKKVRQNLRDTLSIACPHCEGSGRILSPESMAYAIERMLLEYRHSDLEAVLLTMHPHVYEKLKGEQESNIRHLEKEVGFSIFVKTDDSLHPEHVEILHMGDEAEIHRRFSGIIR